MAWWAAAAAGLQIGASVFGYNAQKNAAKEQAKIAAAQLEYQKQWDKKKLEIYEQRQGEISAIFGNVGKNLATYYGSLNSATISNNELNNLEAEFNSSQQQLAETLADRGIEPTSGLFQGLTQQLQLQKAKSRTAIKNDAPHKAAQIQLQGVQTSQGLKNQVGLDGPTDKSAANANLVNASQNKANATTNLIQNVTDTVSNFIGGL